MKWFGRKAGRAGARPFLLRGWPGLIAGEPWPRSYEAQVREAYLHNPVAQRAVKLVADGIGGASVYAGEGQDKAAALADGGLLETVAAQLLLHGNAFVQILLDSDGAPAELFALRPERVSVEADAAGWPVAYVYKAGEAKSRMAARDGLGRPSLVHLKAMHPLDDHYGLGCLGAAAGSTGCGACGRHANRGRASSNSGHVCSPYSAGEALSRAGYWSRDIRHTSQWC